MPPDPGKPNDGGRRGLSAGLQSFGLAFILQLFLPTLPVIVEKLLTKSIDNKSFGLWSGMYVIGLGLCAGNLLVVIGGMVAGIVLASATGVAAGQSGILAYPDVPKWIVGIVVMAFLVDRGYHHVVRGQPFEPFERDRP